MKKLTYAGLLLTAVLLLFAAGGGCQTSPVPVSEPEVLEPEDFSDVTAAPSPQNEPVPDPDVIETEADTEDIENAENTAPEDVEETTPDDEWLVPRQYTYEIFARVHDDMPEYRFVATGMAKHPDEWSMGYVTGLEVFDENGSLILSMDFSEDDGYEILGSPVYVLMMDTMGLHVTDVNFDGYKDIIILSDFSGAHGNTWYDGWLWDTETSSFVYSESFAGICNPAIDWDKQCIYSSGGSGAGTQISTVYQYMDGEFIVSNHLLLEWGYREKDNVDESSDYGVWITEDQLVNGELETIRHVFVPLEQADAEIDYYSHDDLWQLDHPRWYMGGGHHADEWLEH